jgi:hypothetical protein
MPHYLLTGAGFSRNWGGWLASETFEYLLGSSELDDDLRGLLWKSKEAGGGFEDALAELQEEHARCGDAHSAKRLNDLQAAIVGMFNRMDQSFAAKTTIEPQQEMDPITPHPENYVRTFLFRFDAIFTLNQDLLLERHYLDEINVQRSQKWNGGHIPGMRRFNTSPITDPERSRVALMTPEETLPASLAGDRQPYFKLHGSSNWLSGSSGGRLFIMGGNKAVEIDRYPILSWYHREFRQYLAQPGARLMVIGYSFGDRHINGAIVNAVDNGTLRIFIIDQLGVDVIDKRPWRPIKTPDPFVEKLAPRIIGASRRTLLSSFGGDNVEHSKIMRFFE